MENKQHNILSTGSESANEALLLRYLQGDPTLTDEERRQVEIIMTETDFDAEAAEGLTEMEESRIMAVAEKLNYDLKQRISKKEKRRKKPLKAQFWLMLSVAILLALIVISYLVIHFIIQKG